MKVTNLAEKGYRKYAINSLNSHAEASGFWQKKLRDNDGIQFFINMYMYNFNEIVWTANVQFIKDAETWDIDFQVPKDYTIEDVESKLFEMWLNNSFDYYEGK